MAPKFQGVDFYDVDGLLSEEERAVRDTVRAWVDDNLIPIIGEHYVEGKFPKHLVPQMAELGLFGANLPEEYGCAGLNNVAYGLIMQELERGDSGVRSFASVQGALVMYPIHAFGSEEQKRRWLPKMASGEVIGCFGLTDTDYGTNPAAMIIGAKGTKDGWVRAVIGLRQPEAADHFPARHLGEPASLLLLAAEGVDRVHHERPLHRRERSHAGIAAL